MTNYAKLCKPFQVSPPWENYVTSADRETVKCKVSISDIHLDPHDPEVSALGIFLRFIQGHLL